MSRLGLAGVVLFVVCGLAAVRAGEAEPKTAPEKQPLPATKAEPKADAPAAPQTPPPPPLYTRAGGTAAIAALGDDFTERLLTDKALAENAKIKDALAKASRPALRFYATVLLCQVAGGLERYAGPAPFDVFKSLDVSETDWKALIAVLQKTLDAAKAPADQQKDWLAQAESLYKALQDAKASEPVDYTSKEKGFTIGLPKNWERKENVAGATVMATSPEDPANKDALRAQVAVVAEELPLEITPEEFAKASALAGSKQFKEFKVLDRGPVNINGLNGQRIIFVHRMGGAMLRVVGLYFVNGRRGYAINCIAANEQADKFSMLFESVCRRFKLEAEPAK